MVRHVAAVALILLWSAAPLHAQDTILTINVTSASVHAGPSTGSPVIGSAIRGRTFDVALDLGSWVRVSWPTGPDGFGHLHVTWGTISQRASPEPAPRTVAAPSEPERTDRAAPTSSAIAEPAPSSISTRGDQTSPQTGARPPVTRVPLPSHLVGLGASMGSGSSGFAASARMWTSGSLGLQVEAGRTAYTSTVAVGRLSMTRVGASVVYLLPDRLADAVWVRPYLGAGAAYYRSSLGLSPGVTFAGDKDLGYHALGGAELTFASLPQVAVSLDLRQEWAPETFTGFETGGLGVAVAAHWYVK